MELQKGVWCVLSHHCLAGSSLIALQKLCSISISSTPDLRFFCFLEAEPKSGCSFQLCSGWGLCSLEGEWGAGPRAGQTLYEHATSFSLSALLPPGALLTGTSEWSLLNTGAWLAGRRSVLSRHQPGKGAVGVQAPRRGRKGCQPVNSQPALKALGSPAQ